MVSEKDVKHIGELADIGISDDELGPVYSPVQRNS